MLTEIWAHRGASAHRAENTMEAFELAVQQGADGLELDVHLSADGRVIVTHDENTSRVTGQDHLVKTLNWAEIQQLNFAWFRHTGETARAPLLEEVLDLIKRESVKLNIELKNSKERYFGLEEKALACVRQFGLEERIVFSSFNHASLTQLKNLGTTAEIALLYAMPLLRPCHYAKSRGAGALHPYYRNLYLPGYLKSCQRAGLKVRPWTVNEENDLLALMQPPCVSAKPC